MQENVLVGLSLLPVSLFGSSFNWIVVIIILKEKTLKSPFMFLTFVKSLCDSIYLTVYLLYLTPMVILNNAFLVTHSNTAGYVLMVCYEISIHTHFITSMNRFAAVFAPISYKSLFSIRATRVYVGIAALFSTIMMSVVIYILGCRIEYDSETWVAFYDVTIPICNWYVIYLDFLKNLFLVFVDFGIDIVTLLKVQRMRRQFRSGKRSENYTKKETDFLKQCCGQGFCYLMGYTSYLMVPEMNTNKYVAFFMSVMSWCAIAMIDGLFTIVYNCEIRTKLIKENTEISVVSVSSARNLDLVFLVQDSPETFRMFRINQRVRVTHQFFENNKTHTQRDQWFRISLKVMLQNQLVGLSIFPVSFFGGIFNWIVVVIIMKEKTMKSPFMFLTFVKSFCDAVYLTIYLVYVTPMVILADKFLISMSPIGGYILIIFYEISIHTHFITSMNRFAAVFFPISYKSLFSIEPTRKYVLIATIFSFVVVTTVNFILGCHIQYDPDSWVSFYDTTIPICNWYVMYGDFMKNLCLVFVDFAIDIVTLLKVQRMRRQFRSGKRSENYTKKETDFLKQCCGQGFCYLMGYTSYLMVPEMNTNKYVAFFMSVMSWCAIAMIDGLFTIVYNCEIRTKLVGEPSEVSVVSVASSRR